MTIAGVIGASLVVIVVACLVRALARGADRSEPGDESRVIKVALDLGLGLRAGTCYFAIPLTLRVPVADVTGERAE